MSDGIGQQPIKDLMHGDYIAFPETATVREALDFIRFSETKPRILYFYVVDDDNKLTGVVSTRMLLTAKLEARLNDVADHRVRCIRQEAELMDVMADFVVHKYLAMPVVDGDKHLVGIIDATSLTENVADIMERDQVDEVFEAIGYRVSQISGASPLKAFRLRFPWLLASVAGGLLSAVMTSRFEHVLAVALVLSFFLTLILGLGESVSMQSMTVTIQALRHRKPTLKWFTREAMKELGTALLLGLGCGVLVGGVVWLWQKEVAPALVVGGSLVLTLVTANLVGLFIPSALHALKLDPKIASGPLALTISDLFTISIYFSLASFVLG
ncbi:MAG: magnesium transporter [Candidatus Cloacimonetes bacterium]|nr:magnesium transporter [Candidatus Cloacimonadota bacterium]